MKPLRRTLDLMFGAPLRQVAYVAARTAMHRKYVFELDVAPEVYAIKQGAIVAAKHVHRDDGPMLIVLAWPWAHLRPLVWHKEYRHWLQWPFMITIGAVPGGEGTTHRGRRPGEIVSDLIAHGWGVLVFPAGKVAHDGVTTIPARAATVHQALIDNPGKPLVTVTTHGLGRDEPQRRDPATGKPLVRVVVRRWQPDVACDTATFNSRLEAHFNAAVPIPQVGGEAGAA